MTATVILTPRRNDRYPNKPMFDVDVKRDGRQHRETLGIVQQVVSTGKWYFNGGYWSGRGEKQGPFDTRDDAVAGLIEHCRKHSQRYFDLWNGRLNACKIAAISPIEDRPR